MGDVALVSVVRTASGRANKGRLKDTRPDTLAAIVIKEAVARAKGLDPARIGDIIMGCAMPEGEQGMNVARLAGLLSDLPQEVPAMTVNRFCSSGLQSMAGAAGSITFGGVDAVVAGGVESMSMVPMGGNKPSANPELFERLPAAYVGMGVTAENVAKKFDVSREAQDEFALQSHQRAAAAQEKGYFDTQIVPVTTRVYRDDGPEEIVHAVDETVRPETTLEGLAKLRPAFFAKAGTVTAGNASPLTDGAGAAVLMDLKKAEAGGIKALGVFKHFAVVGVPPQIMGIGPVPAIRKLMKISGMKIQDIDLFEINEAFAAQAVYCVRELGIDPERVNPNGGAIALGHPLGATGAMLTAKLFGELERTQKRYGVVSMCIGGGMGAAGLFERI